MSLLHSSTRRPPPLKDTDYDHEINLVDRTSPSAPQSSSTSLRPASPGLLSDSSSRWHSDAPLQKHPSPLRKELTRRKFSKYQDRQLDGSDDEQPEDSTADDDAGEPGRGRSRRSCSESKRGKKYKALDSVIDILYENQRGGFLCGMPLFSGRALGWLDPSPWTNVAQKTSATNITNAQVPDPSWEWAWAEWSINHSDEVDDDGWEYSFAFSNKFSWHGASWWNSFVRRRAWIRKRVKRLAGYHIQADHMLNAEYFTVHPAPHRSRSRASTLEQPLKNRYSITQLARREMEYPIVEDICDIASLMLALKLSRIDREKMEAVESFIKNGSDELYYLRERIHAIMGMFIFQTSRRLMLSHLLGIFNEASDEQKTNADPETGLDPGKQIRLNNLKAAIQHADEEVKKLEFWSDIKDMADKGETKGAVDKSQGWDESWTGLDHSGPEDVISDRDLPSNGTTILAASETSEKGKGKAKE
jgi:hypothetical protein